MRISDWSSDVCSSDLLVHRLAERAQALVRGLHPDQRGEGGLVLLRVLAGGLAEGGAVAFDVEQVVADLEGQAERVGEAVEAFARPCVDAGRDRAQPHRCPQQRAGLERSEEHTSELQSLMRISYAVFCLKKKQKKTNNKRT